MASAGEIAINAAGVQGVRTPSAPRWQRWLYEIFVTLVMVGLLYGVARGIDWAVHRGGREFDLGSGFSSLLLYTIAPLPIVSLLGLLVPAVGPRKSLKTWFLNLRIVIFDQFATAIFAAIAAIGVVAFCHAIHFGPGLIDLRFANASSILTIIGAFVFSLLLGDLFFYFYHRIMHTWTFWQVHKVHHMDEELDAISGNRDSLIDAFIATALMQLPMTILFKLDSFGALRAGVIFALYGTLNNCFIHSNLKIGFGKWSFLYVSPQLHRIHHSRLRKHYDQNFSATFPIWDVIFGTYYAPARDEYPLPGVEGETPVHSVLEAQLVPLRSWWKLFREWRDKGNALKESPQ